MNKKKDAKKFDLKQQQNRMEENNKQKINTIKFIYYFNGRKKSFEMYRFSLISQEELQQQYKTQFAIETTKQVNIQYGPACVCVLCVLCTFLCVLACM